MPFYIAAGVSAAAGIGGALINSSAASDAADKQAKSAAAAQAQQATQTGVSRSDLLPYNATGQSAFGLLNNNLGAYSQPDIAYLDQAHQYQTRQSALLDQAQGQFTSASQIGQGPGGQAALEQTPGYQFTLQQGLQAAQNSAAARGLGVSGAAMKGAAQYATGLADQTYLDQYKVGVQNAQNTQSNAAQFGNLSTSALNSNSGYQGNLTNSYNKLLGTAGLGESAAAQTGTLGQAGATNQTGLITGAGNALASGIIGGSNALSSGLNTVGNSATSAATLNALFNSQNASNSTSYASKTNPSSTDSRGLFG